MGFATIPSSPVVIPGLSCLTVMLHHLRWQTFRSAGTLILLDFGNCMAYLVFLAVIMPR